MSEPVIAPQPSADTESVPEVEATEISSEQPVLTEGDLLVEDVSIDGMCGVY
jgi:mycofactocin precursor